MNRYCVLGGGGSFGLHTSRYLLKQEDVESVLAIGRNPEKPRCFSLGVGEGDPRYSYRAFHIGNELDLLLDRWKPETFINFAAQGEGAASLKHSWRFFQTNCVDLSRLTEELGKRDYLQRFVHIGTSELYGSPDHAAREDDPIQPTSPYAASKAGFDLHLISIHKHLRFPMNIIRPSNCYGEGQQLYRLIPRAILCGLTGKKLPLHGGGRAQKSYMHNEDLARAIHIVSTGAPLGTIYNVGPDHPIAIRNVVELVAEALGMTFDNLAEVVSDRAHQDSRYWLDSSLMHKLGWERRVSLGAGLDRMVKWAREYLPVLRTMPVDFVMRA